MRIRALICRCARFLNREDGPTAVEYAVMLALIMVVCISAVTQLGSNANSTFGKVFASSNGGSGSASATSGSWTGSTGDTITFSGSGGSFTADGGSISGSFTSTGGNNYTWTDSAGVSGTATISGNTMQLTNQYGSKETFTKN